MTAPKPPRSILDPAFVYVPAARTDIRATFARLRAEQQAATVARKAEPIKPQRRKQQ